MPDYSLGRAHGKIEIDYDGSGADRAARDLDRVSKTSESADKSLTKTQRTVGETSTRMRAAGDSAAGYSQRLKDVENASRDVTIAENNHRNALLDTRATLEDIKAAEDEVTEAKKRHTAATDAARAAQRAFSGEAGGFSRTLSAMTTALSKAVGNITGLGDASSDSSRHVGSLTESVSGLAGGARGAAFGIEAVVAAAGGLAGVAQQLAGFEVAFAKISGATLGLTSLGGLAGMGGAAGLQGIVNIAGAAKQLSGVLGLLPATIAGVGFATQTLELAFRGVGDALTSMMDDDPTAFLEGLKDMAPVAAQSMLAIAQFRDGFKAAGAMVQESFFLQIADQIRPLIEMWLPAVAQGMSQVSAIFGQGASMLAQLIQQPAAMAAFEGFVTNISAGLQAMLPALQPMVSAFAQLTVVGSSFFGQIGGSITELATAFNGVVQDAAASGEMQQWIQASINGIGNLIDIASQFGSAFLDIMTIADQFGGGGLLGWLDELTAAFSDWTSSAEGQQVLTDFFSTMREATDAFVPLLGPLLEGLASLGSAFVQLGTASAPGFQVLLDTFAETMAQLGPQLVATAPALNTFLTGLAGAFSQLMAQIGPELPQIFQMLADGFVAILPQLAPLTAMFLQLATVVGPQLPPLFSSITSLLYEMMPYFAILASTIGTDVEVIRWLIDVVGGAIDGFTNFLIAVSNFGAGINDVLGKQLPDLIRRVWDSVNSFFVELPDRALQAGKNLIGGLVDGITSGLGSIGGATRAVVEAIADFFQSSPAKRGPFSGSGYTLIRGQKMITDMAAGMSSARPALEAAAMSSAAAASTGLAGAPTPGGRETTGGALLPDNIASADTSVLTEYLRHQFSDGHGLKGLARDFGQILDVMQSGSDFISSNVMQPVFTALGMLPGANERGWRKMTPSEIAAQQQADLQKDALSGADKGPSWQDVLGGEQATGGTAVPLGLSADSSKSDIQKAIIASGRARGLNDAAIKTALAVAAAESGFDPTISGGVQGSAGLVSGLYQQSPSSGWGTLDQVNDPNYAINAFYDAFEKNLATNPTNPQLAAVLTQNPQLGSSAQGSDYWNAVSAQLGQANSILSQMGTGISGPSWGQVLGTGAATTGTYTSDQALLANVPAGRYTQDERGDLTKGLADCSSAVEDLVNMMDGRPTGGASMWTGNAAEWLTERGFVEGMGGPGDFRVGYNGGHMQATLPGGTPFNWGSDEAAARRGIGGTGADDPAFTSHYYRPVSAGGGGLTLPSGKSLDELTDTSAKSLTVNEQLLQAYLGGNPELAGQLAAARAPGAGDDTVLGALSGISTTITNLTAQDPVGNKNTIDALRSQQNQLAQQTGFEQQPNAMQQAQSIAGGAAGAITGVFQSISSGLDALAATQDIADRLVYGVRNTEDVNKIIDNVQKYITFAADIVSTVGSIMSTAGSFTGGSDMGGTSAAGSMLSLISGVMQGVNAAIDFGQQVYQITMSYVGKFISSLTAGLGGGFDMMGNVGFMLNTKTGQLVSYSQDNPEKQNQMNIPSFLQGLYGYGKYNDQNANQPVQQQLNIFAGPGQSPAEVANETMWLVNTQGTTGALAPANF